MTTLVIAPHADDEVLGVGGTIARIASNGEKVILAVLTGSGEGCHPLWPDSAWTVVFGECRSSAKILGISDIIFENLPAACLDTVPTWKINQVIDRIVNEVQPATIYVPFYHDFHKDPK